MMEKFYNHSWFTKILALGFSILLFSYVNYENNSRLRTTTPIDGASVVTSEVIADVPIVIEINQDEYFVSGLPETAVIRIEGPRSIVQQTITTQGFDIVAQNLDDLGAGTHTIPLVAEGLSPDLSYSVTPASVTVMIEEKRVETYDLDVEFNESLLERGFEAGEPVLSEETVEITGAASTMERVDSVQVIVQTENGVAEDITQTVPVLVSDSDGNALDVNVNPNEVTVTIPVVSTAVDVPLELIQTGRPETGLEYNLSLADSQTDQVNVTGAESVLAEIESYPVMVDVTGITESTTKEVALTLLEGVTSVLPDRVTVQIEVIQPEPETEVEPESEPDTDDQTAASTNTEETETSDPDGAEGSSSEVTGTEETNTGASENEADGSNVDENE